MFFKLHHYSLQYYLKSQFFSSSISSFAVILSLWAITQVLTLCRVRYALSNSSAAWNVLPCSIMCSSLLHDMLQIPSWYVLDVLDKAKWYAPPFHMTCSVLYIGFMSLLFEPNFEKEEKSLSCELWNDWGRGAVCNVWVLLTSGRVQNKNDWFQFLTSSFIISQSCKLFFLSFFSFLDIFTQFFRIGANNLFHSSESGAEA